MRFPSIFFSAVGNGDGSDLSMQIIMDGKLFYECPVQGQYRRNKDMLINKFLYDSNRKLKGDVKFRFISSNKVFIFSSSSFILVQKLSSCPPVVCQMSAI